MANNAETNLMGAKKLPPLRVDKPLLIALERERKKRNSPSIASVIRVLLRERLAQGENNAV